MPPQKKQREKEAASKDKDALNATANHNNNNLATQANNNHNQQNIMMNGNGGGVVAEAAALATTTNTDQHNKINGHQQEQELFLQAFEKPTQIYRFLRNRHGTSPIFLQRTLSYMKERMSRNHKKRNNFKINNMLDAVTQKGQTLTNNYLNIIYFGLFEKATNVEHSWQPGDIITVESTLYKITKSKRKDSTSDFQEVLSYSSTVVYNPHDNLDQMTAISIPAQSIQSLGDQHTIYKLLFRIKVTPNSSNENTVNDQTPTKRSKMSTKLYGCEVIVYEKNIGCIPEGDYDAALQELNSSIIKSFSPKKRSWETLPDNYIPISMKFDVFAQYPTLKFRLTWSANELPKEIAAQDMEKYARFSEISNDEEDEEEEQEHNNNNNCLKAGSGKTRSQLSAVAAAAAAAASSKKPLAKTEKIQIVYNFLYSNNTRQQTEYTQEVICPWCGLDCMRLYSLLKHLKLCHARFNFTYQPAAGNGARIDVTINDSYDGSYAGSPYDLAGPSGCSFARTCGPVRRTSVTNLLVCRPRRQKTCLDEFLELDEDDLSNQRPYVTGHNRLYHHTETCLPVHPKELDIDSEGESDPLWLRQKTIQMIDEFTDVNEGEKELMKLWNLHVMKHGFVGDCQLPIACEMFIDSNGYEIIRKNIYRNFILHMSSLYDYGLISPETFYKIVQKLQGILSRYPEGQAMMSRQREQQLKYWLEVGIHKQEEQKLKSPQKPAVNNTTNFSAAAAASNKSKGETATNTTTGGSGNKKSMQPPGKRSGNTATGGLKRSSTNHSMVNGGGSDSNAANDSSEKNGKGVAKKTAASTLGEDPDNDKTTANGLRRLSTNGVVDNKKSESKQTAASSTKDSDNHNRGQGNSKRRLSMRDVPQPATKRQRSDSSSNSTNNNTASSNTTTSSSSTSNTRQKDTAPTSASSTSSTTSATTSNLTSTTTSNTTSSGQSKRLTTRRQSLAGHPTTETSAKGQEKSTANGKNSTSTSGGGGSSSSSTHHTLRTRLSVPANNKSDKR
ncbi:polycomb protein Su(z)12 [Musca vetustissima]|uniref:polycomb protein Su(z)12 n=1 Tax=Musca vetustissima TaxID=27455 RepID=UPI002AB76B28|nr:polycomb protein Su(z)12 [Musca vetustissima]